MFQQQARFTIHPAPKPGRCRIDEIPLDTNGLVRYSIPQQHKSELARNLYALGITPLMLDPGLAAVGAACSSRPKTPVPLIPESVPTCGGELVADG